MITFTSMQHEQKLREALENKQDPHKAIASWLLEIPYNQVTLEMRNEMKTINFYLLYSPKFIATVNWPKENK